MEKNILITGGAGFIGSHVVRLLVNRYPHYRIVNADCLTYAGNLDNLSDVNTKPNYVFEQVDICDYERVKDLFVTYAIDGVIHLAAESHVDRSIADPFVFARTNVMGTLSLLQAALTVWNGNFDGKRFYHISTDEVYGALGATGKFSENTPYDPHSPYSASKAASDHFVRAYYDTYGLPVLLSNCSNNYGPYQYPEKLIPLVIDRIRQQQPIPVYGQGTNVRDWLYVEDHARAVDAVFHQGTVGETYTIGGDNEWSNIDLVRLLVQTTDPLLGRKEGTSDRLITYVTDRLGHDFRYAIDASKIREQLQWKPLVSMEEGIRKTVEWYVSHPQWIENIRQKSQ